MILNDYLTRFRNSISEIQKSKTKRAIGVAMSVLAQTKKRIQDTGEDYQGLLYAPYTEKYKSTRKDDGFQVEYVDFTRTGRLWNSINPFIERDERFFTVVVLRPRDEKNQNKLKGLAENRGNILTPSSDELKLAIQIWEKGALKLLNKIR